MTSIDLDKLPPFVKTVKKGDYTIRTIESGFMSNLDLTNRIFRSMISNQNGNIVSIAPAKSLPNDDFVRLGSEVRATEIIEGTMINLFWNDDKWNIATKNSVGGDYFFFRNQYFPGLPEPVQKTFRQMFVDGICPNSSMDMDVGNFANSHMDVGNFANSINLSHNRCYSFVVQHPSNHIVIPVDVPTVYLTCCYEINEMSYTYVDVFSLKKQFENTRVKFPRVFNNAVREAIENAFSEEDDGVYRPELVEAIAKNPLNSYKIPGIMVTHLETGLRTSFANVKYNEIKLLRGNNSSLHYQYLMLRKIEKVAVFLQYFPQYCAHFNLFCEHFDTYATRIHKLYLNIHVLKIAKLDEIEDKRDKYHIEKLHYEHFIPALKAFKQSSDAIKPKITRKMVVKYLDSENIMVPM